LRLDPSILFPYTAKRDLAKGASGKGMFITFEGIEGCGKSTVIRQVADQLRAEGIPLVLTLEPGGTVIGEKIRAILLDPANRALAPLAELLLYEADRVQHVTGLVKPALESGKWVLCDRFYDATTVYQGYVRGQDLHLIETLNTLASQGVSPDLTFVLDCPAEMGLKRAFKRNRALSGDPQDRFEREDLAFHRSVREGYLRLAERHSRIAVVDATQEPDRVAAGIYERLVPMIRQRRGR
jgi:dTMP kinase